mgnify:CR=1 FL=1
MSNSASHERFEPRLWRYELPGGWVVLAGRNDRDNDHLSLKLAKANDYWFHVKGMPGSHVVLKVPAGLEPDNNTLKAADQPRRYHVYNPHVSRLYRGPCTATLVSHGGRRHRR